jgi:hypothetical protein
MGGAQTLPSNNSPAQLVLIDGGEDGKDHGSMRSTSETATQV